MRYESCPCGAVFVNIKLMSENDKKHCENCDLECGVVVTNQAKMFRKNCTGKTSGELSVCELCNDHFSNRNTSSQEILNSKSEKRLIVAGPGTGKTYMFGEVIKGLSNGSTALVFTLINNLAEELQEDLGNLEGRDVKVNTFHGYCKELLHSKVLSDDLDRNFTYLPLLPKLIEKDASLLALNFSEQKFSEAFANLEIGDEIEFYLRRASYYNAVSHIDSVFRVCSFFNDNHDRIPSFDVVIADEYQDFNKLESSLVSLLALENHTLLAGDDDQALYGFREAKTDFIRALHNDDPEYENKYLPYCSRCTPAIVESTKLIIETAQSKGLLDGRIPRDFISYWPEKYVEHQLYPKVNVAFCSTSRTVSKYIETEILRLTEKENIGTENNDVPFMVIGPESGYHLNQVKDHLLSALDQNVYEVIDSRQKESGFPLLEAYELLRQEVNLNLAWRMILYVDPTENLKEVIESSYKDETDLQELLPAEYVKKHLDASQNQEDESEDEEVEEASARVKILLTNFLGSKGLAALHVFVLGFSNYTFPQNPVGIKNEEVCKFVVALTRAKNSCSLIANKEWNRSSGRLVSRPSIFLSWLSEDHSESAKYRISKGRLIRE